LVVGTPADLSGGGVPYEHRPAALGWATREHDMAMDKRTEEPMETRRVPFGRWINNFIGGSSFAMARSL
jgi:hypothetical protein